MKLSIIVPVYNVDLYIVQCLKSIASQTYKDFECILVDDGSTDGSKKICEAYAHSDKRFRLLVQPNKGVNFARDLALQQAKGEYIGFVDADDYIAPDMFFKLMDAALRTNSDIVICGWCDVKKNVCTPVTLYPVTGDLAKERVMEDLASDYMRSYLWNKLFKRQLLERPLVLLTAQNMGDYSWMHYIFHKADRFFYVKESLYFYRYRAKSIINNSNFFKTVERYAIARERRDFYKRYYPHMLAMANLGAFKHAWKLCSEYACSEETKERGLYLEADSFTRLFAAEYIKNDSVGKKERMSLWLYIHFTKIVRRWKNFKNKVGKYIAEGRR